MNFPRPVHAYPAAIGLVAVASFICEGVRSFLAPTNMVMAYLLAVVIAAGWLGLWPAILTAFMSVVAFDVLFVPPRFSFRVSDSQYIITFLALFVVGVVISSLVARIQEKVEQVRVQEARTSSLYYLTRGLSAAADVPDIVETVRRAVLHNLGARLALAFDRGGVRLTPPDSGIAADETIVRWVLASGRVAGKGTSSFKESALSYLPIKISGAVFGVLIIDGKDIAVEESLQLLEAFAGQVAMAIERVELTRRAEEARVLLQKTHLEQALLNSISHDLRTPLVTIAGTLDTLLHAELSVSDENRKDLIISAADEAARLNRFVGNLLDMARIDAGALSLRIQETDAEDIVGCTLAAVEQRSGSRSVTSSIDQGLPPVPVDLVLVTQALTNLVDNALKFSPQDTEVVLSVRRENEMVVFSVSDKGPGVPDGMEQKIFDKFYRLDVPEKRGGTGLGLAIAKGIVEAHRGTITAFNRQEGGLLVEVALPTVRAREGASHGK